MNTETIDRETGEVLSTTVNPEIEADRARAIELANSGRKELAVERAGEVSLAATGGIDFGTLKDLHTAAGWMCKAGPMLPPWLQNNHGGMFGICLKAHELGISALALANWSYVVTNKGIERVAYEAQFFNAIISPGPRSPLKTKLQYEIIGEGDDRRCRVWATMKGEDKPREFLSDTLAKLRPDKNDFGKTKGSPLWDKKPEVQMFYNASRDFARLYCPEVIGGLYSKDELDESREGFQGPQNAKDVTPFPRRAPGEVRQISMAQLDEALTSASPDPAADAAKAEAEVLPPESNTKKSGGRKGKGSAAGGEGSTMKVVETVAAEAGSTVSASTANG